MEQNTSQYSLNKPSELRHNNSDYALVDDSELRGSTKTVNNITERDLIPLDKRGFGVVKYRNSLDNSGSWVVKSFVGSDNTDINWVDENNWIDIAISQEIIDNINELNTTVSGLTVEVSNKIDISEKGFQNGVAPLNANSKIDQGYLEITAMVLEGEWNANTNTPTLIDGVGAAGQSYNCTTSGTTNFGNGNISFAIGDFAVYGNNGRWFKQLNSNDVTSVNGKTGTVIINKTDVGLSNVLNVSALPLTGGTLSGNVTAPAFIKAGGTSSQFLKANGSVDSNVYLTSVRRTGSTLTGAGTSASPLQATGTLDNADLATYETGGVPGTGKRLTQIMANDDYWSIYGEGVNVNGRLVIETGDNANEPISFATRNGVSGPRSLYATFTPTSLTYTGATANFSGYKTPNGTSSQFLKADGSSDSSVYITGVTVGTGIGGNGITTPLYFNGNLTNSDLTTYENGGVPPTGKKLYQITATNDYWTIYGEGTQDLGKMIIETGDNTTETINLATRLGITGPRTIYGIFSPTAVTFTGATATFASYKTPNGTSSQFLKANGSVDSNVYLPLTGGTISNKLTVQSSVQVSSDVSTASVSNVGSIRYRTSGNNSYCEMVMQTGASTYDWVIIKQNSW